MQFSQLVKTVKEKVDSSNELVTVALSGFCGAGKSTLAERLSEEFRSAPVVSIDDFITKPRNHRSQNWSTFDRNRFKSELLDTAEMNSSIGYTQFQTGVYVSGKPGTHRLINIGKLLIVEGVSIFTPELIKSYSLAVWINCPIDIAVCRAKQRGKIDKDDNGWLLDNVWRPNDVDFYGAYRPDELADVIYEYDAVD